MGIVVGAAIVAGSSLYAADQQREAAASDRDRREREAAASKAEADRIARETKPEEEALAETKFGVEDDGFSSGSTQDFVIPKQSGSLGGSSGRSGLGFTV